jgi:hypothetical protein
VSSLLGSPHTFPALLIALQVVAAIRYGFAGDWWHVGYWLFAGGINVCATWGMR